MSHREARRQARDLARARNLILTSLFLMAIGFLLFAGVINAPQAVYAAFVALCGLALAWLLPHR